MEENTENSLKSNSGKWQIVKNVIYTINHMLIAFNTSYLTWHCFQAGFSDATTWHALLLTVGYQLLMAEGILSFSTSNSFTSLLKRNTKTKVHLVLQAMGGTLALTGVSIQFLYKIKNGEEHWSTPHAVVGSISITFLILTSSSGWSAFFGLNLKNYIKLVNLKIIHVLVSLIAFTTGMLAICSGYLFKDWTIEKDPGETRVWIARLTLITLLITIMAPLKSIFFQMKKKII